MGRSHYSHPPLQSHQQRTRRLNRLPRENLQKVTIILVSEEDPEGFPLQTSKEDLIEDLKTQSKHYENNVNRAKAGVTGIAFSVAAWMTFL